MTQPQFTPGPWEIDPDNNVLVRDQDGNLIADCDVFQYTDDGEVQLEDCPGNARLISAAPELLEALQNAPLPSTMGTAEEHYRRFYDWLKNVADPAIAKATGAA